MRRLIRSAQDRIIALKYLMPWASLAAGVATGFLMKRDYLQTTRLIAFAFLLLLFTFVLEFWFKSSGESRGTYIKKLPKFFQRAAAVEWIWMTGTQIYLQYILMFCLPFLIRSEAWLLLAGSVAIIISSFWDPWWLHLAQKGWYNSIIRIWGALLAWGFIFPLFFPTGVEYYHVSMFFVLTIASFPFLRSHQFKKAFFEFIPFAICFGMFAVYLATPQKLAFIRFPLLSVWVQNPILGADILDRSMRLPFPSRMERDEFNGAIETADKICCLTPIVAPPRLDEDIVHRWYINDKEVDIIVLPPVRGSLKEHKYRTFSCKSHLGNIESIRSIRCEVFVGNHIRLGEVTLSLD